MQCDVKRSHHTTAVESQESLSRCHTKKMNITFTGITGSTYSSAFSDPLTIDIPVPQPFRPTNGFHICRGTSSAANGWLSISPPARVPTVEVSISLRGVRRDLHSTWFSLKIGLNNIPFTGEVVFSVAMESKCPNSISRSSHQILWNP